MATIANARIRGADRRLQIMEVAKELFSRQGFEGTTTREIAQRAKVNEAIIFRHFPTKQDLYWEIIEHECRIRGVREALDARLNSGGSDYEIFVGIAEDTLRRRENDGGLTRLLLYSALEDHKLSYRFFQTRVASYFEVLSEYIRKRIAAGAFRSVDPLLAARAFLGMVIYHSLIQELYGGKRFQNFDIREVASTVTDIWLGGMVVRNGPERKRANGRKQVEE
jgi:AcrR family transcriptional regulator